MLKLACVETQLSGEGQTEVVSSMMFHGAARRPGAEYPLLHYSLGDHLEHPLRITRNVYRQPAIFRPLLNWIVDRRVADILRESADVGLLQVEIEKLIDEPYLEGEERWEEEPWSEASLLGEDDLYDLFAADPSLPPKLGDYFEVILPDYAQIGAEVSRPSITLKVSTEMSSRPVKIRIDRELLSVHPMFSEDSLVFLSQQLFERLEAFLDRRFFRCVELEVDL